MLRRSTGNKVKRLQEQANLAQSALTSLKIAEDRALSEIRGTRRDEIMEEPESKEEDYPIPNYCPSSPEDIKARPPHLTIPEEDEHAGSMTGRSLGGNSTTKSELEIEKFYRELELEMFGEEELPSMVGQMLEVPLKDVDTTNLMTDPADRLEYCSVNSAMSDKDLDDALLEQEQNRSMISEYLLEDADNDSPKLDHSTQHDNGDRDGNSNYLSQLTQPIHSDQIQPGNYSLWNKSSPLTFPALDGPPIDTHGSVVDNQTSQHRQHETIPLHAGMTMFEDCALLGGRSNHESLYFKKKRRSSRNKDMNAGPKVHFIPPPTHLSPSDWMNGPDSHDISCRDRETITISEDNFSDRRYYEDRDRDPYGCCNNKFHPNFHCR
ncbi:unnamed protein product [Pseudo-nitzschia multistriata]|uniref:Uncharacterized protein n=1 Tax=Pseudo-nitzschia multistriata TaxID=183589 RepID=A0A448ZCZ6_9STRA|nr:unnamed protein product [Pseudo-nitzschia multistriata]